MFVTAPGQRVFNVSANGTPLLTNFDILAQVAPYTALQKSFTVTLGQSGLDLNLFSQTSEAMISGISLVPGTSVSSVSVAVTPNQVTLKGGQTQLFAAQVNGASNTTVTWTVSGSASPLGTIDGTGLYTAPATVTTAGTVTITATSAADPTKAGTATVNLQGAIGVSVTAAASTVVSGQTDQFSDVVTGTSNTGVNWSASLGSISSTGLYSAPAVSSPTPVTVSATSAADSTVKGTAQITVDPAASGPALPYLESSGQVTMEAENGTIVNRGDHRWDAGNQITGFSGTSYLSADPNVGTNYGTNYVGVAPEVDFQVNFSTTGTYYIWVRGYATSYADDSVNVGIDGAVNPTGEAVSGYQVSPPVWGWASMSDTRQIRTTLVVSSPGTHTINVWMREDGFNFDKILLSSNAAFTPTGVGPAESPRGTAPTTPILSVSPTTLSFTALQGGSNPAAQSITISNAGAGTLTWSALANQSWIGVPASGTAPASAGVSINIAGLAAGNYSGKVTITAAGATNSPQSVNVALSVTTPAPVSGGGSQFYVAPNGTAAGDGSINNPWDLQTALNQPAAVQPGATIWMRGGIYTRGYDGTGIFTSRLNGTATAPIVVRQYPGERATLDGGPTPVNYIVLQIVGSYTWYQDFEVTDSNPQRYDTSTNTYTISSGKNAGIMVTGVGDKLINLVVHDTTQGFSLWKQSTGLEMYGCIAYYNGWQGADRAHGHNAYMQNIPGTVKLISDNITFDAFGWGLHAYGSADAPVTDFTFLGNITFNNGSIRAEGSNTDNLIVVGGGDTKKNVDIENTYSYHPSTAAGGYNRIGWNWDGVNQNVTIKNNYFMGGYSPLEVWNWNSVVFTGNTTSSVPTGLDVMQLGLLSGQSTAGYTWDQNTYYDTVNRFRLTGSNIYGFSNWQSATGVDRNTTYVPSAPTGVWIFVRPNKYVRGRGNVAIYNWDLKPAVDVDVSSVLAVGTAYEIRDAQNFFGAPLATGVYGGGTVRIPMTGLTIAPTVGSVPFPPVHTAPTFGAFVILPK